MNRNVILRLARAPVVMACLIAATLLAACSSEAPVQREKLFALGTIIDVSLFGVDEETAHVAAEAVRDEMTTIHHKWHAWEDSELTRLNGALAGGRTASVDRDTHILLGRAQDLAAQSGHLFNPAVGKLIAAWGFHTDNRPDTTPPPSDSVMDDLVQANPTMADLTISESGVSSRNRNVQLDFGGFAKGYAVDKAIERLRAMGIGSAIVNAGGDLRAIGSKGTKPWRVGIRDPRGTGILASVEVHGDESVFTSGDYERFFEYEGRRYHHIIDPRTGQPSSGAVSVTVIHDDATTADAAATALMIAGPDQWTRVAKQMGLKQVMLVDDGGTVHLTPDLSRRIQFETDEPPAAVVETL